MNLIIIVLIGLSAIISISCKQSTPSPEEILKNRQQGSQSSGVKPGYQPIIPKPSTPPPAPAPPPAVTLPAPPEKDPPAGDIEPINKTLEEHGEPTWELLSPDPPSPNPYDQTWINLNFNATKGQENYSLLYNGVDKIIRPPLDGSYEKFIEGFLAYGENAFAAMAIPGQPQASFAAGAKYGLGKVFVFGARKWFTEYGRFSPVTFQGATTDERNQITFLKNVLTWLLGSQYPARSFSFLTNISEPDLSIHSDFKIVRATPSTINFPNPIDVATYPLVIVSHEGLDDNDVTNLLNYIKNGGSVLIGVRPWNGKYDEHIIKILRPAGITYYQNYKQDSDFFNKPIKEDLKKSQFNLHSFYTLAQLEENNGFLSEMEQRKIETAFLPKDDPAFSCRIARDFEDVGITFPFDKNKSHFDYSLLLFRNECGKASPYEEPVIPKASGVAEFPGIVPVGTPLVERNFTFNLKFSKNSAYRENLPPPNWQATGLYAPPGKTIKVNVTRGSQDDLKNFRIFINTHTDDLTSVEPWKLLKRHPLITTYHFLKPGENKIRNQYGGLIVLEGLLEVDKDQIIELTISEAVEAPWLKEDTTEAEFQRMKNLDVPWAMIQGPRSVAVLPIEEFKKITSAQKIRDAWTYFHILEDRLTGKYDKGNTFFDYDHPELWPAPHKWPDGRTWHVIDTQIGGDGAHAGNPIMYESTYGNFFNNPTKILSDAWTLWHELGHNHQQKAWTTLLDQEVTTNILSAYMQDNGYKYLVPKPSPPPFRVEVTLGFKIAVNRLKTGALDIYQTSGPICSDPLNCPAGQEPKNNNPYRRLIFFMQLIRYTEKNPAPGGLKGYDIFSELYRRVRNYPEAFYKILIASDASKTDNLCRELSDITKIDLTDFFEKWGRSLSNSVEQDIKMEGYLQPPTNKPIWKCDPYNPASDNPC